MAGIDEVWQQFALYGEAWSDIAPQFVHIEPVSSRSSLHDWNIAPHSHPGMHQMLLLERGGGELTSDGERTRLEEGMLVAVPSQCVHAFAFDPGSEGWVMSVAVELLGDPRLAASRGNMIFAQRKARHAMLKPGTPALVRLVWLFSDMLSSGSESQAERLTPVKCAELGFLLAAAEQALGEHEAPPPADPRRELAERFRLEVDKHFVRGWSVPHYARELATTEQTLTRACNSAFGKPPGALIHDRLLIEAIRYLSFSGASVKEISARLGFSDPAYFARFFKQKTGVPASEFRQRVAPAAPGAAPQPDLSQ